MVLRTILCVCLSLLLAFQGCASHSKPSVGFETAEPEKRSPSFPGPRMSGEDVQLLMIVILLAPVWVPIWLIYDMIDKMTHKKEEPAGMADGVRSKRDDSFMEPQLLWDSL